MELTGGGLPSNWWRMGSTANGNGAREVRRIVLGGGCFWCLEALYQRLEGVIGVQSGYAGGHIQNPSYKEVCSGSTGHTEVVEVAYDMNQISLRALVDFFWEAHDPTTLNRQGADVGTQYRSAIYYEASDDLQVINESKAEAAKRLRDPIVTEIAPLEAFYPAEDYHADYFNRHQDAPYCRFVIAPKVTKLANTLRKSSEDQKSP